MLWEIHADLLHRACDERRGSAKSGTRHCLASPAALGVSAVPDPGRLLCWCCVESHGGRSSGRCSSFCTRRVWCGWWGLLDCVRACVLAAPGSVGSVGRAPPAVYGVVLLIVLLLSPAGCVPIDFSLAHRRRGCCGAPRPVGKVGYPPIHWPLGPTWCRLTDACAVWVSSSALV